MVGACALPTVSTGNKKHILLYADEEGEDRAAAAALAKLLIRSANSPYYIVVRPTFTWRTCVEHLTVLLQGCLQNGKRTRTFPDSPV